MQVEHFNINARLWKINTYLNNSNSFFERNTCTVIRERVLFESEVQSIDDFIWY